MSSYRAVTLFDGHTRLIQNADTLIVGAGIETSTGAAGYVSFGSAVSFLSRTTVQRDALVTPVVSSTIWNSTTLGLDVYYTLQDASSAWLSLATLQDVELGNDPVYPGTTYANIRTFGLLTQETWTRTAGSTLLKSIDYTFSGSRITQQVTKLFAANGTTVVAQTTQTFTYTGSLLTGGTIVRNV